MYTMSIASWGPDVHKPTRANGCLSPATGEDLHWQRLWGTRRLSCIEGGLVVPSTLIPQPPSSCTTLRAKRTYKMSTRSSTRRITHSRRSYVTQVITTYPMSSLVSIMCNVVGYMVLVGNGGPPFILAAFSTLRGYALSGRKWWVGVLIVIFYIPDIVLACLYFAKLTPQVLPPPFNCILASGTPEITWVHIVPPTDTIAARLGLVVGDLIVLVITWKSTFGIMKTANSARIGARMSLTNAILKNGTILLILNVLNIIVNAVPNDSAVSAFQYPITSILVSRFLLNLRDTFGDNDADTRPSFVRSRHRGTTTTIQFAAFVDPMGANLDHGLSLSDLDSGTRWSSGDDNDMESTVGNELASMVTTVIRTPSYGARNVEKDKGKGIVPPSLCSVDVDVQEACNCNSQVCQ
ncbi:hypothetical protein BD413DRAFT_536789 [Trametes elegans]|nr:hypothetical protein BD413DRAFT_536789 [Trametes elegans]